MCSQTCETHIPSDMCSPIRETHIPSDMCSPTWETHIPRDMCSPTWEIISLAISVPSSRKRISLGNIGQENVFYDILARRNALLGYKSKKLEK